MPIYMIRAGSTEMTKIGCSKNIPQRLKTMQPYHYEELYLLRTIEGGRSQERWLQHHFQDLHVSREWYRFHPEMMTVKLGKLELPDHNGKAACHPLRNWLLQNGITVTEFSQTIGTQKGYLSAVMNGLHLPSPQLLERVVAATNREIMANDFQEFSTSATVGA